MMDVNMAELRALLLDLVAIPSLGDRECGVVEYLACLFRMQGIPFRITTVDGVPMNIVAQIGSGGRTLVLNTHMDVVPPGEMDQWATDPFAPVESEGVVVGRGAADAKGSLAAMALACSELARRQRYLGGRVVFMAVGGEERGGIGTKAELDGDFHADAAIVGEPTGLVPMIAHKGVLRLRVRTFGKAAHASSPEEGVNAVTAMARVVGNLDRLANSIADRADTYTGRASLVVSTISGGIARNVVPESCEISVDRRVITGESECSAAKEITDVVHASLLPSRGERAEVEKVSFIPPSRTDLSDPIVSAACRAASEALGRPVEPTGFPATCDMSHLVHRASIPTVILGPGDIRVAHKANETLPLHEAALAVGVYLRTAQLWFAQQEPPSSLDR
ncbi:MAG: M20 family metallopeptidase [Clostridia bacterium]|nr:M20 family metallopeptidase [Clostridia bacterium]